MGGSRSRRQGSREPAALAAYDYAFPQSAVALRPARPRDAAKLLVYDRRSKKVQLDTFAQVGKYLPTGTLLVLNQTKVMPARLECIKPTGGRVRLLFVEQQKRGSWLVLADRKVAVGDQLRCGTARISVRKRVSAGFIVAAPKNLAALLQRHGLTPLPPYLRHSPLSEAQRRREYQTVFAKKVGSSAAPTASLHFTDRLLKRLHSRGVELAYVTLHVGLGTFAPVTAAQLKSGQLHQEHFEISAQAARAITRARKQGRPVIAVGTTALRALESAALNVAKKHAPLGATTSETRLFIRPGYRFKVVDGLITNFHVPRSSLLMLVAALIGRAKLLELYRFAIKHHFRLFSFGDAMLIT